MNNRDKILFSLFAFYCAQSYAGGFLLWEQNGSGVGDYHAGSAVEARDASTEFYNPAGLVYIDKTQGVAGAVIIPANIEFNGTIRVSTVNPLPLPAQSVSEVPGGGTNVIPNLHFSKPINPRLTFGFGLDVPYGLQTNYGRETYVRYAATETSLQTIDVTPSLGYRVTDQFSIGAGFDAVYAKAKFDQYAGGVDPLQDTLSDNNLNSWGWGYHLGAMYQITPATRFGLAYHSKVDEKMTGKSVFSGYFANGNGRVGNLTGGTQTSNNLRASMVLPPNTTLSGMHELNDKWLLLGSVTFTQWDYIKALLLQGIASADTNTLDPINNASVFIQEDFRNAWNVAIGTEYKAAPNVTLRAGAGYDQSPVANPTRRYIQTPDSDRYALAVGGQLRPNKKLAIDFGWTHLFIIKAPINSSQTVGVNPNNPNPNGETVEVQGSVNSSAEVFGLQVAWNFD